MVLQRFKPDFVLKSVFRRYSFDIDIVQNVEYVRYHVVFFWAAFVLLKGPPDIFFGYLFLFGGVIIRIFVRPSTFGEVEVKHLLTWFWNDRWTWVRLCLLWRAAFFWRAVPLAGDLTFVSFVDPPFRTFKAVARFGCSPRFL